ncbi:peptidylprolyl isomerase [Synechocystis sp. LKSZ1]|uniref:peptidylprolyl isomerase n=1 Tax=Synechocystis sp. LKSZ1 TaxID=3144951 RepID=UPI00336C1436
MVKFKQGWWPLGLAVFLILNLVLGACEQPQATSSPNPTPLTTASADTINMDTYKPRLDGNATVEMIVNGTPILIAIDGKNAPVTAGNFVDLVERGFYNGLSFHRVVREPQPFVVQGGDPLGNGTGGFTDPATKKPRNIPLEIKLIDKDPEKPTPPVYGQGLGQQSGYQNPPVALPHKRGAIAMARSQSPNSASSQFYFALSDDIGFLDGDYAVFGYVTKGMEAIDKIKQGDKIQSAKVIAGAENLKK